MGIMNEWSSLEGWLWWRLKADLMLHAVQRVDEDKQKYWVWAVHSVTSKAPPETGFAANREEAQRFAEYSADGIEARREKDASS